MIGKWGTLVVKSLLPPFWCHQALENRAMQIHLSGNKVLRLVRRL
jgi:hypothetical protein